MLTNASQSGGMVLHASTNRRKRHLVNPETEIHQIAKIITIFGSIGQLHHFHTELQNFQMKIIFWQKVHKYHVVRGKNNENGQNTHADPWDLSDKNAATYFRIL